MRMAIDFLRRHLGFVHRPAAIAPASERVRVSTPTLFPGPAGVTDEWDADLTTEKQDEPAMAGIPEDAVQMPTPAAPSPGLPPVDPMTARKKSVAKVEKTARKAPSSRSRKSGESGVVGRRSPAAGSRNWQDARYRVED